MKEWFDWRILVSLLLAFYGTGFDYWRTVSLMFAMFFMCLSWSDAERNRHG